MAARRPFARDLGWGFRWFIGRSDGRWSASIFEAGGGKRAGEATLTHTILGKDEVVHVYEIMPHTKTIFIMRSPLERPWSTMGMRSRVRDEFIEEIKDRNSTVASTPAARG